MLRAQPSQRSLRVNSEPDSEWIEHKVGPIMSLVRNQTFRSPGGFRRQYSSYLIQMDEPDLDVTVEEEPEVVQTKAAHLQSSSSQAPAVRSRPQSSLHNHRPARCHPIQRPKSSIERPKSSMKRPQSSFSRSVSSTWSDITMGKELPRPKTTDGTLTLKQSDSRPQTAASARKGKIDDKTKRLSKALPTRVPLQPMTAVPSDTGLEDGFLQLVGMAADEGLLPRTSTEKASNKIHHLRFVKPESAEGPLTTQALRNRTVLRYLGDEDATPEKAAQDSTTDEVHVKPPVSRSPAAFQRLKSMKGGLAKAERRFWNNDALKSNKSQMAGSTVMMLGGHIKKLQTRATLKVHDEHEFIKAMLHTACKEEPVHKNAEGWLAGVDALLDKRAKLRMYEAMQFDAQQEINEAQSDISTTSHLIGLQKEKGAEKKEDGDSLQDLEDRLAAARKKKVHHERQQQVAKSWADRSLISIDELDSVKPGVDNSVTAQLWHNLREEIGQRFPDEDSKENMFRRVQVELDDHRKGWWRENFPTEEAMDDSSSSSGSEPHEDEELSSVLFRAQSGASATPSAMVGLESPRSPKHKETEAQLLDPWRAELHQDSVWVRKSRDEELRLEALIMTRPCTTLEEQEAEIELRKRTQRKQLAREQRELLRRRTQARKAQLTLWPTEQILRGVSESTDVQSQSQGDAAADDHPERLRAEHDGTQGELMAGGEAEATDDRENKGEQEGEKEEAAEVDAQSAETYQQLQDEEHDRRMLKRLIDDSQTAAARFELAKALRFPGLVKALHTWYDKYLEAERLRRGQVKAYERMCTLLHLPAIGLGTLERFVYDKDTDTLKIPGFNLSASHMTVICCLFKGEDLSREDLHLMPTLKLRRALGYGEVQHINCANNNIRGQGTHQLVKAIDAGQIHLLTLDVSFNALGEDGAQAIANLLKSSTGETLQELDVSRNLLGDYGVQKVAGALVKVKNPALRKLSLSKNEAAYNAGYAIGQMLHHNTSLQELDISWNQLKGDAAVLLGGGLEHNKTLKTLYLQWNALGDSKSAGAIAKALPNCKLEFLDLSENRMGAPGAFLLAEGLEANVDLTTVALNGNPLTMQGAREILKTNSIVRERVQGKWDRKFQMHNCGVGIIAPAIFDPAEPAGLYQLDMKDPVNHRVMKNLIKLTKQRKGFFDRRTAIISEAGEGTMKIKKMFRLEFPSDDAAEWILPDDGILEFNFADKRKPPGEHSLLSPDMMGVLIEQLQTADTPSLKKVDYVHATVGSSYLSYEQLVELLSYIPVHDAVERVHLVSRCFHRLANVDDPRKALNLLVGEERAMAEKQLGNASFAFFKNNATGFHRLDLTKHSHRDVAVRLVGLYNAMDQEREEIEKYYDGRAGGKRDISGIGLIWRNAKVDGVPFTFTSTWPVPYSGTLEVDFVDIRKPPPSTEAMSAETFQELVLDKWDQKSSLLGLDLMSATNKLRVLREASNLHYFSCHQIAYLLARFRAAKHANVRIEIVITCWSKTVDWHGLANVLQVLTPFEYRVVVHRLGFINVFDEIMAVGFWDLDLAISGERFVFQELYHLAMQESGQSIVHPTMNGVDTVIPDTWVSGGVPEHGKVTLFFVRSGETLDRVFRFGAMDHELRRPNPSSISTFVERYLEQYCQPGCNSAAGREWIHPYRCRRIRRKLMEKFDRPQACFSALDKDKSGSLSRAEISVGLVSVGVWLHPNELEKLLQELDKDGSGSVEVSELVEFWSKFSPQNLI